MLSGGIPDDPSTALPNPGRGTAKSDAYVSLSFAPGKAYQFDWSQEVVVLHGATVAVRVA